VERLKARLRVKLTQLKRERQEPREPKLKGLLLRMSRLVVIRIGDQLDLWLTSRIVGLWSSPESHAQVARHFLVEGFRVIALFVGRGDIPIAVTRLTGVRGRLPEDGIFPVSTDLGELRTFLEFDTRTLINLEITSTITYNSSLEHIKYKVGSQHYIPPNVGRDFLSFYESMSSVLAAEAYTGNMTYFIPQNSVNYII